jgi:hypothetical protein
VPAAIGVEIPAIPEAAVSPAAPAPAGSVIPEGFRSPSPDAPCALLIPAGRADLLDPGRLDGVVREARDRGLRIVVRLVDDGWPAGEAFPADDWIARSYALARRFGSGVEAYQIFERAATRDAKTYAFLLKRAAVILRAASPEARIVLGALGPEDDRFATDLFALDAAPYVDVLAADGSAALTELRRLRDRLLPRAPLWVQHVELDPVAPAGSAARAYFEALGARAAVVFLVPPAIAAAPGGAAPSLGEALVRMRALLPPGMNLATEAALPYAPKSLRTAPPSQVVAVPFYDPESRQGLVAYRTAGGPAGGAAAAGGARFTLRAPLDSLDLLDPVAGTERRLGERVAPGAAVEVPIGTDVLLLRYRIAATASPVKESVRIGSRVELSAEEILARERQFGAAQAERLKHYEAHASINIHYRISALDTSVDILTENDFFSHEGKQEYRETAMYVDGAIWRGKKPPYLPFIQPEKIKELPLEIELDESYRYALLGRDTVDGRECYVLSIAPRDPARSLYEGKVFIDTRLFARVRMEVVETNTKPPLRSSHVTYRFAPIEAAEGSVWLPVDVSGQMVFEVIGQNLVVERRATYSEFAVNRDGFDDRLARAYDSGRPIFRDTRQGLFLVERSGGQERLENVSTKRNTLLVMGVNVGIGGSPGLPFAGADFFDFDFHGTGTQMNIVWAGPFLDLSWTDPHLTDPEGDHAPVALTLAGSFDGIPRKDRRATDLGTDAGEDVDIYPEGLRADLSVPIGRFFKWTLEPHLNYSVFRRRSDTSDAFVLPASTSEETLLARLELNRAGVIAAAWGEAGHRDRWPAWGLAGSPFDPRDRDFTRRGLELSKSFYFGRLTKWSLGASAYDGASLDRFSSFQLGDFRTSRVRGFNGSGIHFDRGLVANTSFAFTIHSAMRVDLGAESGWIHNEPDFGPGYERVVGGGFGLEFSGPWDTLVNVRFGYGFSSTIPDKGGGGDFRIVFFRTFNRWMGRANGSGTPSPSR